MVPEDEFFRIKQPVPVRKKHPVVFFLSIPFRIVRRILRSIWHRTTIAFYQKIPSIYKFMVRHYISGERLPLISASDYAALHKDRALIIKKVCSSSYIPIKKPRFSGHIPDIDNRDRNLFQPELTITEYRNARPLPASDFVLENGYCIHPDLYVPERDVSHAERVQQIIIDPEKNHVITVYDPPAKIGAAISLLGQCAGNYAHFLTEVLPKLMIVDQFSEYNGIPLLVDIFIDRNIMETIKVFNTNKRKIYFVHIGRPVFCDRLIVVSSTAFAPPEYRAFLDGFKMPKISPDTYVFSKYAIALLQARAEQIVPDATKWIGKKIYVKRKISHYGNAKNIINIENIEEYLRRAGFSFVEPGSLSPKEQIEAFRGARVVVGQAGAALANLMYTKPGCKVIILSAYFQGCDYDYFNNLMPVSYTHLTLPTILLV